MSQPAIQKRSVSEVGWGIHDHRVDGRATAQRLSDTFDLRRDPTRRQSNTFDLHLSLN